MKSRFTQIYLHSAGVILAVTALGKAIPPSVLYWCTEQPMFGSLQLQLGLTNERLLETASILEMGIVLLLCSSKTRWLGCLGSALWGASCVFMRLFFMGPDIYGSCNCLGWLRAAVPLPSHALNTLLLTVAAWLALGGFASLGLMAPTLKPIQQRGILAAGTVWAVLITTMLCYARFVFGPPSGY